MEAQYLKTCRSTFLSTLTAPVMGPRQREGSRYIRKRQILRRQRRVKRHCRSNLVWRHREVESTEAGEIEAREALSETSAQILSQPLQQLLPILRPFLPALFKFGNATTNLPIRRCHERVHDAGGGVAGGFEEFADAADKAGIVGLRFGDGSFGGRLFISHEWLSDKLTPPAAQSLPRIPLGRVCWPRRRTGR
jgi:hypothetical protein